MSKNKRDFPARATFSATSIMASLTLLPDDLWHVYVPLTSPIATENSKNRTDSWAPRKCSPWIKQEAKKHG